MPNVTVPTAIIHREAILSRMVAGERLTTIAQSLGVTPSAISRQLSPDPEYQAALKCGVLKLLEQREKELETAPDTATYARARELLSHARWMAERLDPQTWSQVRQAMQINADGPVSVRVVSYRDDEEGPYLLESDKGQ
jgi:hypothetical protein